MNNTVVCHICKIEKSKDQFHKNRNAKNGIHPYCKPCRAENRKRHAVSRPTEGTKHCRDCDTTKNVSEFSSGGDRWDGLQNSCKICQANKTRKSMKKRMSTKEGFFSLLFADVITNAKHRNLEVSITKEYIMHLFEQQNEMCALSGRKMTLNPREGIGYGQKRPEKRVNTITNVSVDRIDSNQGYTESNVQLLCSGVNTIKWDLDNETFKSLISDIYHHGLK